MKETDYPLFVYGTLKKGFGLHHALNGSPFISNSKLKGFRMFSVGGFPCVERDESAGTISGEIYAVDPVTLRRLDAIEGAYNRELYPDTEGRWVGVYVWDGSTSHFKEIPSGVWG